MALLDPATDDLCEVADDHHKPLHVVVFSGGTAMNSVASAFRALTTHVTHVLPVSDDGGSTAEIVRVLGGPAVGDIRSRCLRMADSSDSESRAVKRLLAHRLHKSDPAEAKREWMDIVEGEHPLWEEVRVLLETFLSGNTPPRGVMLGRARVGAWAIV